jgi:WD40 repeat protein
MMAGVQKGGGTGEPNDPYQIATAEDLMLLGESPEDYDKHFILTADIDLDPNLPGRKVGDFQGTPFTGVFDGHGHNILHLTIEGGHNLGLFGQLGQWDARAAAIKDLGVVDININGTGRYVGGLVGRNGSWNTPGSDVTRCYSTGAVIAIRNIGGLVGSNKGDMTDCYSTGLISGKSYVGGLMGSNTGSITTSYSTGSVSGTETVVGGLVGNNWGDVTNCYRTGVVSGGEYVGGLVGKNAGTLTQCYSSGAVNGDERVGGLVGSNYQRFPGDVGSHVSQCYNTGSVNGTWVVGGLVGDNDGVVTLCYSTGAVSGEKYVGGLVGSGSPATVTHSVWDTQASGLSVSAGGVGLTTTEMMDPYMLGLNGFANDPNWVLDAAHDYPRLAWEGAPGGIIPEPFIDWLEGQGTPEDPYRVDTADQLILLGKASILCDKHFVLGADIALDPNMPDGQVFGQAVIPIFTGVFDGNGHTISNLTMRGGSYVGLFGQLRNRAEVKNLGVVDVSVTATGRHVGGLLGCNHGHGIITNCYTSGTISGRTCVGGLIGWNDGEVTGCYSAGTTSGDGFIGGLVGYNVGNVLNCYSTGSAISSEFMGGLVGYNFGNVLNCYSTGTVSNKWTGGGLVGAGDSDLVNNSVWDVETSGLLVSAGGTGLTTAEMQTAGTFVYAGWDFVGETENGTEDIWWILEGQDYPRLWWQLEVAVVEQVSLPLRGESGEMILGLGTLEAAAYSPDGKYIATAGSLGVFLWDAETGALLRTLIGHTGAVYSVAFSPGGKRVLTGSSDFTAKLWDAETGQEIRSFLGHVGEVWSVAFSPDGTRVLTGSEDCTAKLWDAETGQEIRSFLGRVGEVWSVAFSPDGTQILTGSSNFTAKLWDAETGQEIRTFGGHLGGVLSVAFSPDGTQILTRGVDPPRSCGMRRQGRRSARSSSIVILLGWAVFLAMFPRRFRRTGRGS